MPMLDHRDVSVALRCRSRTDSSSTGNHKLKDRLFLAQICRACSKAWAVKQLLQPSREDLHLGGLARHLLLLFDQVQLCPFIYPSGNKLYSKLYGYVSKLKMQKNKERNPKEHLGSQSAAQAELRRWLSLKAPWVPRTHFWHHFPRGCCRRSHPAQPQAAPLLGTWKNGDHGHC